MSEYFSAGSKFRDEFGNEYLLVYLDHSLYTFVQTNGYMSGFPHGEQMSTDGITTEDIRKMIGYHTFEVIEKV